MSSSISGIAGNDRDRFLNFAFANADMLVEVAADTQISWAAGAFASRFGRNAESFLRQPVEDLVAPAALHGRLAPVILRMNDARETRCVLGGLAVPDKAGRLCLTFGAVPVEPMTPAGPAQDRQSLLTQAEASLRAGQNRALGLLDVAD